MDILIVGAGVVGAGVVKHLVGSPSIPVSRVVVIDRNADRAWHLAEKHGPPVTVGSLDDPADVVVLATASGTQARLAHRLLDQGRVVLATSDSVSDVRRMLGMNGAVRQ